jgi:hypothetical protein
MIRPVLKKLPKAVAADTEKVRSRSRPVQAAKKTAPPCPRAIIIQIARLLAAGGARCGFSLLPFL